MNNNETLTVENITREKWILNCFPEWGQWLNEEIEETEVKPHTIAMWWLGVVGVYFKTPGGANVMVDPWVSRGRYSHYTNGGVEDDDYQMTRMSGSKKMWPYLKCCPCVFDPFAFHDIDAVLSTHFHGDHIDPYVAAAVVKNCPDAKFIGPEYCKKIWLDWKVPEDRIIVVKPGDKIQIKDMEICAVESFDRTILVTAPPLGPLKNKIIDMDERAVNFVLRTADVSVYHSGDSHYSNYYGKHGMDYDIDVAFGSFGSNPVGITDKMGASEICRMAEALDCEVMIPIHYDLWTTMAGDPHEIELLWEAERYRFGYKWKPYIWQVGGKFVFPDDKDKRQYMYPRGCEDRFTIEPNLPFTSIL